MKANLRLNYKLFVSFFVCLIIVNVVLFAASITQDNDNAFQINLSASGSYSELNEYVYEKGIKESEINWQGFSPAVCIVFDYGVNNFGFNFAISSAIPVEFGTVVDKDFFISGPNINKTAQYSKHDLITDKDYSFSLQVWYSVPIRNVELAAGISGVYSNFKAETDDGFLQYPDNADDVWTGTEGKESLNGTAITYEQQRLYAGIGLMFSGNSKEMKHFNYYVKGLWYPLVKIDAIDNHFLRLTQFCDSLHENVHGFSVSTGCSYIFTDKIGLNVAFSYKFLEASGTTKTSPIGVITYNTSRADENTTVGTTLHEFHVNMGLMCSI